MSTRIQPKIATVKGPDAWFTGDVYVNAYYAGTEPSRMRLNLVRLSSRTRRTSPSRPGATS